MSSFWRRVGLIHPAGVLLRRVRLGTDVPRGKTSEKTGVMLSHTKEEPEARERGAEGTEGHSPNNC